MLLAKIKGNKVLFWKFFPFFWEKGVYLSPTDPLDPLEVVLGGHLLKNFPRGGSAQILSLSGVRTPKTPSQTSMSSADFHFQNKSKYTKLLLSKTLFIDNPFCLP